MQTLKTQIRLGLLVTTIALSAGCTHNTTSLQVQPGDYGDYDKNTALNSTTLGGLEITKTSGRRINGLYEAQVVVKNRKKSTQNLQYFVDWINAQGDSLDNLGNGWTPLIIYGEGEKTIRAVSPNSEATNFRVSIRDLKADKTLKINIFGIE